MNDKSNSFYKKIRLFFNNLEDIWSYLPKINTSGYPFIVIFFLLALILSMLADFLGWLGLILTLWCIYFFRDPERITPKDDSLVISPADGKILNIIEAESPENIIDKKKIVMKKVSIFMDVFNVHVNRIPVDGKITWLKYVPGVFLNASLDKSHENNERMITKIEAKNKSVFFLVQIAGLIARRIKCDLVENQSVVAGDRFGLIRFGSRVDIYLPQSYNIKVLEGQTVISGETIIGEVFSSNQKKSK